MKTVLKKFLGQKVGKSQGKDEDHGGGDNHQPAVAQADDEKALVKLADPVELSGGPLGVTGMGVPLEL